MHLWKNRNTFISIECTIISRAARLHWTQARLVGERSSTSNRNSNTCSRQSSCYSVGLISKRDHKHCSSIITTFFHLPWNQIKMPSDRQVLWWLTMRTLALQCFGFAQFDGRRAGAGKSAAVAVVATEH